MLQTHSRENIYKMAGWVTMAILPPVIYFSATFSGMSVQGSFFLGIMTAVLVMWLFRLVDEYVPAVLGMFASLFFGLAPPSVALSGMASPSLLTLIGAFALASAIAQSGLARRLVLYLLIKLPDRFFWQQNILLFCGLLLSIVSPSGNTRIALLLPLCEETKKALGLEDSLVSRTSMIVTTFGGAMLFSTLLSNSKSSSVAALSMLPTHLQTQYLGLFWLAGALVPMGILVLVHFLSVKAMFANPVSHQISKDAVSQQLVALGDLTYEERIAGFAFIFFLVGTVTSEWHFVSTPSIAGMTLALLLLSGVMNKASFQKLIDWPMVFFLLALDSMMETMAHLGLENQLAGAMRSVYGFVDGSFILYTIAALVTTLVLRLVFPVTAGMLISFVILLPVTIAQGYDPWICVFMTALFSDIWFFRYQSSVYLNLSSSSAALDYDHHWFMRHNLIMNLARALCVFAAIPMWQWMGLI